MNFTVIGAGGFIGGHLVAHLRRLGHVCDGFGREFIPTSDRDYGHVVYAAGVTADFRQKPLETIEAHVCGLKRLLERGRFASLLYLSSTRVYQGNCSTDEAAALTVSPINPSDLYNLSKLAGECLCLTGTPATVRVARLANVIDPKFAPETFLGALVAEALARGSVLFQTSPDSAKDFVALDDVLDLLHNIALSGTGRIYNVASGKNISNTRIAAILEAELRCTVRFADAAPAIAFTPIKTARVKSEFAFSPRSSEEVLRQALRNFFRT